MRKASVLVWVAWVAVGTSALAALAPPARAGGEAGVDGVAAEMLELLEELIPPHAPVAADGGRPKARVPAFQRRAIAELTAQILKESAGGKGPAEEQGLPAAARRCALGIIYAHLGDLMYAQLHLGACVQPEVGGQLRERGGQTRAAVARSLRKSSLSPVDIATAPPGWIASIESLREGTFATPHTLWLPAGKHVLRFAPTATALHAGGADVITRELQVAAHSRGALFVDAPVKAEKPVGTGKVSFEEEAVLEAPHAGPPPPEKHKSMLPDRYRKGLGVAMPDEPEPAARRAVMALQAGGGWQAPTDARRAAATTRLAAQGRVAFAPRLFVELGVDWTHRFDDAPPMDEAPTDEGSSRDAFGALLGARLVVWQPAELSLLAALRGRLEASDRARAGGLLQLEARPIARWPIALGGTVELERGQRSYSGYAAVELWTN